MKNSTTEKCWIVFLSTYPPRECGLATFTADLIKYFDRLYAPREETRVLSMNTDMLQSYNYSKKVIFQLSENKIKDYLVAAEKLNKMPQVKIVSIQHEFGIFGHNNGQNILTFLQTIKKPVAITFHTVLPKPLPKIKKLMKDIAELADILIVMTSSSKQLLESIYGIDAKKIKIIPHGAHPLPYTDGKTAKTSLRLAGKKVLSTFGLLNSGKGIEHAIGALPEIVKKFPETIYLVIGATHPFVLKSEGEIYRNQLINLAYKLGVENNILFYDKYLATEELLEFLQATDIYLSLSQNPDQAVSGTLTYALGAGRTVISTPFMQAKEIITPEIGLLVDFNDNAGIAKKVISLFENPKKLTAMSKAAYFRTRSMIWPNIALSYMREFTCLSPELEKKEKNLPPIKLKHLKKLTDNFGIFQFANLEEPDPAWGYTLDDNARALIVASLHHSIYGGQSSLSLIKTYLSFIERAAKNSGGFINYFTEKKVSDDDRNKNENLEDANARSMWSLSVAHGSKLPNNLKSRIEKIFTAQCQKHQIIYSPRATAFYIKALVIWLDKQKDKKALKLLVHYADFLLNLFNKNSDKEWFWFEQLLAYSNAVLPEALLLAYKITGNYKYFKAGKVSLDFLIKQSFQENTCMPIGQRGWYKKGQEKQVYDQQPEEVSALILALRTMFKLTGDIYYSERMTQAFNWYLGGNVLNQFIYSQRSGGCYDGLGEGHINLNQGAESTISYLLSRLALEKKADHLLF
ncbi:MAG: glycosyltransferase [Patescibacteria group bacterium]|jgi:glycosyltransferase involved in cell wall biosynthesis